jgi:hypothetical protein
MSDLNHEFGRGDTPGVEVVMSKFLSLAVMCSLAFPAMALAQESAAPEAPKQAADDLDAEYGAVEPAESAEEEPAEAEPVAEEPAAAETPTEPAELEMAEPPKTKADDIGEEYAAEQPEEGARPFLDGLSWQLMASAFYMFNGYRVAGPYNDLEPDPDARPFYPYTAYMGFGLNFAGGDVMYTGEKFAVRLDLRFGTGADQLTPLAPIKQAYVAYLPHEKISLDMGFFDTIYGAEVVDEWQNANYSRGALYFLRQPFNHMGLRAGFEMTDIAGFTLMVTNGTPFGGTPIDDNEVPSIGWQFGFSPDGQNSVRRRGLREGYREVGVFFGGNHGPTGNNGNKDWFSFFDLVLSINLDWFTLLFNGDYTVDPHDVDAAGNKATNFQYGHSLALIFDASDHWSIGMRGEHLSGNDQYKGTGAPISSLSFGTLWTGTLTIRYKPVEYLVLSLEGRVEGAKQNIYYSRSSVADANGVIQPDRDIYGAIILGATAHIGN